MLECIIGLALFCMLASVVIDYLQIALRVYSKIDSRYNQLISNINNIALIKHNFPSEDVVVRQVDVSINALISIDNDMFELLIVK